MIQNYRKKPVVIEAVQWTGNNAEEIMQFVGRQLRIYKPSHSVEMIVDELLDSDYRIVIPTLEGDMMANRNDFIIKGVNREFYPCKPDIFEKTYEPAD
jgi:hypothetical protein